MIIKTYIQRNLKLSDQLYLKNRANTLQANLYCKFAVLEMGGWIEISMDDIAERLASKIATQQNKKHIQDNVIKKNYGFDYDQNFKKMISNIIGIYNFEKMESKCTPSKIAIFKASLNTIKSYRNSLAHTYTKNALTPPTAAPSTIIGHFPAIYDGLKDIESALKKMKLI